jgi:hypothetical protein
VTAYLLVESRSDQESPDVPALRELAIQLCEAGHQVTLFLVQNAVLTGPTLPRIEDVLAGGVQVWADRYSVAARGLPAPRGLCPGGMDDLVRLLMSPATVAVWH